MYEEDNILLQELQITRNLSPSSLKVYKHSIRNYTDFCGQSFTTLLEEAEDEEEQGVRWKHRRLRKRLIGFRAYLMQKYEYKETIRRYFTIVQTIYRHYEIELQPLPLVSTNTKKTTQIVYDDIPSKDLIRKALTLSNPKLSSIILLICSSGMGRTETTNLTVQDFIDATKEYHHKEEIHEVLNELDPNKDIIPTWQVHRQKTNKDYFTFSTPESTRAILYYLYDTQRNLTNEDLLFGIKPDYLGKKFGNINNRLGLGKVGAYNRFRAHMLRKYHASQLNQGKYKLGLDEVDSLQGRGKNSVHRAYFLDNPMDMKRKYESNMHRLFILEEKRDTSNEYAELQRKYDELQNNIKREARNEVRKILMELGYEL